VHEMRAVAGEPSVAGRAPRCPRRGFDMAGGRSAGATPARMAGRTPRRHSSVGRHAVLCGVIDLARVNPRGRDIGVDSLATELVIARRPNLRDDTV
jgi:hypothetical protein